MCPRAPGPWPLGPAIHGMFSSGTAAEGEAAPTQPASEKEPDMPSPREESEEDEDDDEAEEDEEGKEESRERYKSLPY